MGFWIDFLLIYILVDLSFLLVMGFSPNQLQLQYMREDEEHRARDTGIIFQIIFGPPILLVSYLIALIIKR